MASTIIEWMETVFATPVSKDLRVRAAPVTDSATIDEVGQAYKRKHGDTVPPEKAKPIFDDLLHSTVRLESAG